MDDWLSALAAGALAGLAVAMPIGPMALLIIERASRLGFGAGAVAGMGVATTDGLYALLAAVAGTAIATALESVQRGVQVGSALVLLAVVAYGLLSLRRPAVARADRGTSGHRRTFAAFLALTAINPLTIATFAALIAGLPDIADAGPGVKAVFVAGAFAASAAWQTLVAAVGAFAHARLPAHARTWTGLAGYGIVAALALRMLAG